MSKNNMELIGKILQRAGALGDAELARMLGELMSEVAADNSKEEKTETAATAGSKYVICVEATMPNGTKLQHPLIGGYAIPRNIDDIGMIIGENLIELQRNNQCLTDMLERTYPQVKVRYVPVTDEAIDSLNKKLRALLTSLDDAINKAAEAKAQACGIMNVEVNEEDISDEMLSDIIQKTLYAGAALTEDGRVVERENGVKYAEEEAIERAKENDDDDDDGDGDEDEDDYDEDDDDEDYDEDDDQ